jgi:hypothetical protein
MIVGSAFHTQSLIQPFQPAKLVQPVQPVQPASPPKDEPSGRKEGGALSGLGGSLL